MLVRSFKDPTFPRQMNLEELQTIQKMFQHWYNALLVLDHRSIIQFVNEAFTCSTGFSEQEIIGKTPHIFNTSYHSPGVYKKVRKQVLKTGSWYGELWYNGKNGETVSHWFTIFALSHKGTIATHYAVILHQFDHIKERELLLQSLPVQDDLTGLLSRKSFKCKVDQMIQHSQSKPCHFALFHLDLNQFKFINDTLGYDMGDQLLQLFAKKLEAITTERQGVVSRISGDQFSILLPDVADREEAVLYAEFLVSEIANPFIIEKYELFIKVSIGLCLYPMDGESYETLQKHADLALYWAKKQGGNVFQVYTHAMSMKAYKTFSFERSLHLALPNREFELYYQPRVEIQTGNIVGAEALIRWNHPHWGLVSPMDFIPLAEETGLISEIDEWVKMSACQQIKEWQLAGLPSIPISINVFAKKFMKQDFPQKIQSILEKTGVDGRWLEIEITESFMIQNADIVRQTIQQLKSLGIKVSLDDFGTGYSSLFYLTQFPIDILKIDRSFIRESTTKPQMATVLQSIIQMAHELKLSIVAEGVETEEQLALQRQLHCQFIQGYLFSPPVPAEQFVDLLVKKKGWTSLFEKKEELH